MTGGCGAHRRSRTCADLMQIMLPLIGPALTTLAIVVFTGTWNSFFLPLIFLDDWQKFT